MYGSKAQNIKTSQTFCTIYENSSISEFRQHLGRSMKRAKLTKQTERVIKSRNMFIYIILTLIALRSDTKTL